MSFMGIDPGNGCTAVTIIDDNGEHVLTKVFIFDKNKKDERVKRSYKRYKEYVDVEKRAFDYTRILWLARNIVGLVKKYSVKGVMIENYAFGMKSSAATILIELGTILRSSVVRAKARWREVTPGQLQKFATGKGRSPKELILLNVFKRWNEEFEDVPAANRNDAADSYVLAKISYHYYSNKVNGLVKYQKDVLDQMKKIASEKCDRIK